MIIPLITPQKRHTPLYPGLSTLLSEWAYPGRRSVGTPHQTIHDDPAAELTRLIEADKAPIYMSANPYGPDDKICALDRLFFDFDHPNKIRAAYDDAAALNHYLAEYYNSGAFTTFSGSKGYHVYVFLERPIEGPEPELKAIYGELQRMITTGVKYRTLDPVVIGDVKRLCRVPYSKHQKTGDLCVPVTIDNIPEAYKLQQGFTETLRSHGLSLRLVDLARTNLKTPHTTIARPYTGPNKIRPCIEATLAAESVHDPEHIMKVAAVAELLAEGYTEDQIVDRFRDMDGFNERKTRYFVRHSARRGYRPFKCETITKNDGCLGPECPIYRRNHTEA